MAPPFLKGTLVYVEPETRSGRRNSEGGVAVVESKKKIKMTGINGSRTGFRATTTTSTSFSQDLTATSFSQDSGVSVFNVRYKIGGLLSQEVDKSRVRHTNVFSSIARRRNSSEQPRPSIISSSHIPAKRCPPTTNSTTNSMEQTHANKPKSTYHRMYLHAFLIASASEKIRGMQAIVYHLLRQRKKRHPGWLRRIESPNIELNKQLSDVEKKKAMDLLLTLKPDDRAVALVAHAWGKSPQAIRNLERKMLQSPDASVARAPRSDIGQNVWTSAKKRQSLYTPRFVFGKLVRSKHPDELMTQPQIDEEWEKADKKTKDECAEIATEWVQRGPFLFSELTRGLQLTKGSTSWQTLATLVSGNGLEMVSANTIARYVKALNGFSYKSTKLLPKLDAANILRRLWWAEQFWVFWQSAVSFRETQIILVHMDEKWFWSIVVRRNLKSVPLMCVEPVQHGVQHKSHLGKIMGIATTAYAPHNNNMTQGGQAYLVSLTRVGKMAPAKRDTYRRVYKEDGSYHYPSLPENKLRNKGELYFKGMEITGSKLGTEKDPKFDLVSFFQDTKIPALESICQQVHAQTGKHTVIRYQMDGAGPHQDKALNQYINREFSARGWFLKFQPSNSPVTNVKDDCIFPAISKHVSREQGITKGSQIFSKDELWAAVEKCWNAFPLNTLSRAYVCHAQIASALIECKGGDEFVRERGGLHYNVRKCCTTVCNDAGVPIGVEVVTLPDEENDRPCHQLHYPVPDVTCSLANSLKKMTTAELHCLYDKLHPHHKWFDSVIVALNERDWDESGDEEIDG